MEETNETRKAFDSGTEGCAAADSALAASPNSSEHAELSPLESNDNSSEGTFDMPGSVPCAEHGAELSPTLGSTPCPTPCPTPCREHRDLVDKIIETLPDEDTLDELEELFKIFGDSTRIKILYVLHEGELCVCDIAAMLGMTQSAISHQLRVLRQNRLIRSRRDGKNIYYALADDHVHTIIDMGIEHIAE